MGELQPLGSMGRAQKDAPAKTLFPLLFGQGFIDEIGGRSGRQLRIAGVRLPGGEEPPKLDIPKGVRSAPVILHPILMQILKIRGGREIRLHGGERIQYLGELSNPVERKPVFSIQRTAVRNPRGIQRSPDRREFGVSKSPSGQNRHMGPIQVGMKISHPLKLGRQCRRLRTDICRSHPLHPSPAHRIE